MTTTALGSTVLLAVALGGCAGSGAPSGSVCDAGATVFGAACPCDCKDAGGPVVGVSCTCAPDGTHYTGCACEVVMSTTSGKPGS
jgi:hypothetical protein